MLRSIVRGISTSKSSSIKVALCLQRYPTLSPPMTSLEKNYSELVTKLETETSYLSDHEMRHKREKELTKQKQTSSTSTTAAMNIVETAVDFEDRLAKEFENFQFMPRQTDDDKTNNLRSHHRKLDQNLVLIVKRKDKDEWIFPEKKVDGEKSLRQVVENLIPTCGNLHVQISGNAPWAVYNSSMNSTGEKVFFYKGEFLAGHIKSFSSQKSSLYSDHAWIVHEDLPKYLSAEYFKAVRDMLFVF